MYNPANPKISTATWPSLPGAQRQLNARDGCWPFFLAGPRKHLLSAMILLSSTSSLFLLVVGWLSVFTFIVGSARAAVKLFILISHHPGAFLQWFGRRSAITLRLGPESPLRTRMRRREPSGQCIVAVLTSAGR